MFSPYFVSSIGSDVFQYRNQDNDTVADIVASGYLLPSQLPDTQVGHKFLVDGTDGCRWYLVTAIDTAADTMTLVEFI